MNIKVFAVIDTNVVVSSALSDKSFPHIIFDLIESKNIFPIFDNRILNEYYKVLNYDKFSLTETDIFDILYSIVSSGILLNDVRQAEEYFADKDDIPFYEVTASSEETSPYLVTGNTKHFPQKEYIVTPHVMLATMEYMDRFLKIDYNYQQVINDLLEQQLGTSKYTSGQELLDEIFDDEQKTIRKTYFN